MSKLQGAARCADQTPQRGVPTNQNYNIMNPFDKRQLQRLAVADGLVLACFCWPLFQLALFAAHSELFSYILLIPFISVYLIWSAQKPLNRSGHPCWPGAAVGFVAGAAFLAAYWIGWKAGWVPARQDYLALMTMSFLCCFWGAGLALLGLSLTSKLAFPAGLLLFMVPLPLGFLANVDALLQITSAVAAAAFFSMSGEPVLRQGLELHLPGFSLTVAPECSGIHSTIVLLITSVLAAHLFLKRFWTRCALVLAVIPLAILRNGFRIWVVGELCVHVGPQMIRSPIHKRGGPIFFVLSLIPFFLWLLFLRKRDLRSSQAK
jgi:exosortase C (VPDSG-CTERM-specific)